MSPISLVTGFLVGPTMILATSKVMGIHGVHLYITIVQVALPQGIVPFVLTKEHNTPHGHTQHSVSVCLL
ncbi:hypothetical protein AAZX31_15G160100 [Glycine max]